MKKLFFLLVCFLFSGSAFAGGIDMEFFGFKVCNIGFDVNPFSRDDGRTSRVCVRSCAPQYYVPPTRLPAAFPSVKTKSRKEEREIVVMDSSNVTIINHESQQTSRPVYAPTVQTYTPVYYTTPVTYNYPVYYYSYPGYYCRPYYGHYCHPYYRWW